jgi:hypothetical protein
VKVADAIAVRTPAASIARTFAVCSPLPVATENALGLVHAAHLPVSSWH